MNQKLRKWLAGWCRARPDGTWLAEVPVIQAVPASAFVLPDEATKDAYLARAAGLGRFHLVGDFVASTLFLASVGATRPVFDSVPSELLDVAIWTLLFFAALPLLWRVVAKSADRTFRGWLEGVAVGATQIPELVDRRHELHLCRPGWMVAAEALIIGALLASMARRWIPLRFEECSQAFGVVGKEIGSTASSANGCFGAVDLFIMVVTIGTATLLAASWWRWRRWNKRHA